MRGELLAPFAHFLRGRVEPEQFIRSAQRDEYSVFRAVESHHATRGR